MVKIERTSLRQLCNRFILNTVSRKTFRRLQLYGVPLHDHVPLKKLSVQDYLNFAWYNVVYAARIRDGCCVRTSGLRHMGRVSITLHVR
jgi:hypothetical protein